MIPQIMQLTAIMTIVHVYAQLNETLQDSFGVKMRITSAYHPQSNGLDERTNQTLKRYQIDN